ncbi:MAG: hypothetical protein PHT40_04330 [Patescibacteria group bacterium]|nr:hypothetical protein [Patescibacteria group bacterium]
MKNFLIGTYIAVMILAAVAFAALLVLGPPENTTEYILTAASYQKTNWETLDGGPIVVDTSRAACDPFGFYNGQRIVDGRGNKATVIGVACIPYHTSEAPTFGNIGGDDDYFEGVYDKPVIWFHLDRTSGNFVTTWDFPKYGKRFLKDELLAAGFRLLDEKSVSTNTAKNN